jgi:protein involved in polysaccharide export with SLBB domain
MPKLCGLLLCAVMFCWPSADTFAQSDEWGSAQAALTRAELESLRARYEAAAESSAYSNALRTQARMQAAMISSRLTEGDFQVGDRVAMSVEGQELLTKTFDIGPGIILPLPSVGDLPLRGVLRSELEGKIAQHIGRVIVDPAVHVRPLVRFAVVGEVVRPGFYAASLDGLITDALMEAGGPTGRADLNGVRIERGTEVLYSGSALQEAIIAGRTLNQLNVRAGDRVVVPQQQTRSIGEAIRLAVVAIPSLVFVISQLLPNDPATTPPR